MPSEIKNTNQLLELANSTTLYIALIKQLNKDFSLANIDAALSENSTPQDLKSQLYLLVENLINNQFDDFLNLLYRIDVSENQIRKLPKQDYQEYIATVSFLILKREWKKVWLKKKYKGK